jgi:hypothetical protein
MSSTYSSSQSSSSISFIPSSKEDADELYLLLQKLGIDSGIWVYPYGYTITFSYPEDFRSFFKLIRERNPGLYKDILAEKSRGNKNANIVFQVVNVRKNEGMNTWMPSAGNEYDVALCPSYFQKILREISV